MNKTELTFEEKSTRVLAVIYKLSGGKEIPIKKSDLVVEIARSKVLEMSCQEFEIYRQSIVNSAHSQKN